MSRTRARGSRLEPQFLWYVASAPISLTLHLPREIMKPLHEAAAALPACTPKGISATFAWGYITTTGYS